MTFPTEEQRDYINSSIYRNIYLEACPGSGKTEVIASKLAKEIEDWRKYPAGIAALSFANSAAAELESRLVLHLNGARIAYPHWLSTIDSFVFNCLVAPVAHFLTGYPGREDDFRIKILDGESTVFIRTKYAICGVNVPGNKFDFDLASGKYIFRTGSPMLDRKLNAQVLEEWQLRDLRDTKTRFMKAGFATYRDIEHLAIDILQDARLVVFCKRLASRFPLIVIDECQDLSAEQLTIMQNLLELGVRMHVVGDLNQSIYGFRNSDPSRVKKFIAGHDFEVLRLSKNFRSSQSIVDVCCCLVPEQKVDGNPNIAPISPFVIQYDRCPSEALPIFDNITKDYERRVVVSRGHSTLNKFHSSANDLNDTESLALACALSLSDSSLSINKSLSLFGGWLAKKLEYSAKPSSFLCPVSVESELEWRLFLHKGLVYLSEGASTANQSWKAWCRAIKGLITQLPKQAFISDEISVAISGLENIELRSPNGLGDQKVQDRISAVKLQIGGIRLTTIHEIKGETHEATMLVSGLKKGDQSHWADWIADKNSEAARLAYVASSRPRNLLVWAVKKLKAQERAKLQDLGFKIS